jgi:lysophospholipase L1-like esterase
MRNKKLIENMLLLITVLIVCLLVTETVLRIFFPNAPSIYQPDDILLYKLVPNSSKVYEHNRENGNRKVAVRINSWGFRGENFQFPSNRKRIVVYGDSFIEGEFSSLEDTFVKQLENELNADNRDSFEVINAGVVGYGPDQESLKMERELDALKPDLVVVSIFPANDFGDLVRNKIYRLNSEDELQLNSYELSPSIRSEMQMAAFPKWWHLQITREIRRAYGLSSGITEKVHQLLSGKRGQGKFDLFEEALGLAQRDYREYVLDENNTVKNLFYDYYDADVAFYPERPSSEYKIKLLEKVILRIRRIADSRGIPLVLLIIPSPIDVLDNYYPVDRMKYKKYRKSALTDIVETIARRSGIRYLNLFPHFRKKDPQQYYFINDNHWNEAGQKLAAELLAKLIFSEKIL